MLSGGPEAAAGDDVTSASVSASSGPRACTMAEASVSASANASAREGLEPCRSNDGQYRGQCRCQSQSQARVRASPATRDG